MKRCAAVCLCLLSLLCLSACNSRVMEHQTFALCMSIDIDKEDRMTIAILTPMNGSGANTGAAPEYTVFSATGDDLESTFAILSATSLYPLNFSQLKLCMISYELTASRELLPMIRWLANTPDLRPDAVVMIAIGNANEVMKAQNPDFGMRMSTHLKIYLERMKEDETNPCPTVMDCLRELESGRMDPLLSICAINPALMPEEEKSKEEQGGGDSGGGGGDGKEKDSAMVFSDGYAWSDELLKEGIIAGSLPRNSTNPVEYIGSATVGNGRVSGLLDAMETQIILRTKRLACLGVAISGERTQLQIWLPKDAAQIEQLTSEKIKKTMEKLQALHCDALGFGGVAAQTVYTDAEWEALNFEARYPMAEVYVGLR